MKKVGIFGGTFNPVHAGHVKAALGFIEAAGLDRLLVIPDKIPPHKIIVGEDHPEIRFHMTKLAFDEVNTEGKITVSDMEIRREGKSFSYYTMKELTEAGVGELYLYCGTDMLLSMDTWHEPNVIFSLAEIVCMRRESDAATERALTEKAIFYRESFGATVRFLDGTPFELSSSEVRARIASEDTTWKDFVSPDIAAYITERGLYR